MRLRGLSCKARGEPFPGAWVMASLVDLLRIFARPTLQEFRVLGFSV